MKRNSTLLLLCAVLLHWHSPFEFGAFASFDDWKPFKEILVELEQNLVDEQNSALKPRPHLPTRALHNLIGELHFLMSMANKLPVRLDESSNMKRFHEGKKTILDVKQMRNI
uniref:Obesity factor n=1 Tax=Globodera pallida TaxID=36090 RepID=A0A183BNV1_GLOPA